MKPSVAAALAVGASILGATDALTNLKTDWDAYVSPLVIPEVLDLREGGAVEMQMGRASHNWTNPDDGTPLSGDIFGYALKNSTPTYPGPTILVAKGVPINVTWYNELSAPHLLDDSFEPTIAIAESHCYPYCGVPAVVHIHGLESPAKYDGLPFRSIYKNQSAEFVYLNNQSAATKVYHDHANGLTRLNVWAGLVGAYIINDAEQEAKFKVDVETDIPLIIGDRLISNDGALMYSDDNCQGSDVTLWIPESFGTVNVVNGVVMPYLEIPPAQVRFRVANNANSRNYNFSIPFADKCKLIAKDSGFVQIPEDVASVLNLYPLERVELFCDFSADADGTEYELVDIPTVEQDTPYDARIMKFIVKDELKTDTMTQRELPERLNTYKDLKALYRELGGKNRSLFLGEMEYSLACPSKSMIRYRGMEINMTTIHNRLDCTKGKVEKWHFQNPTDDPHPFHWHLVNAQCGPTDDEVDTNSLKDVVVIPNDPGLQTVTQVCYVACTPDEFLIEGSTRGPTEYNFDTSEPYVAHCHILEHEENNMMSLFQLTDVDDDAPNDDGYVAPTGVINSAVIATAMGMSVLGGFATTISVLVISVERLKFLAETKSLSIAFALSAGVMVFIAFADLWTESVTFYRAAFTTGGTVDPEAYENGGSTTSTGVCDKTCGGHAWLATSASFVVGVLVIIVLEFVVHRVLEKKGMRDSHVALDRKSFEMAEKNIETGIPSPVRSPADGTPTNANRPVPLASPTTEEDSNLLDESNTQKSEFRRAGMMTGIAIAIHNFPEGLALFVSSLQGLRTGIVLAIGIILHNLPEGVAIAAPVYYATGSKLEAFKWTALSGIAQPFGAAIGWAAVSGGMSYALQAFLYSFVAGMLMCITAKELLPGAHKFDPKGKYFVSSFFIGVGIIAFSLILIHYAGSG